MSRTKQEVIDSICLDLGIARWETSTGSTEPKGFLLAVADSLGIPYEPRDSKPALAKRVVESGGEIWLPTHESEGATVTRSGLEAVERSVRKLLGL